MKLRIITGEKSKSCVVAAIGASLYLVESAFEEGGVSVAWGLGLLLTIHAVVVLVRFAVMAREPEEEQSPRLVRSIIVATLLTGLVVVAWIYVSGKAFQVHWQSYVNAFVIGGLSAIFHLIPLEKFKKKSAAATEPNGLRGPTQT